jgi:hypothetical protein
MDESKVIVTPYRISDGPSNTNGLEKCPGGALMLHDNARPHAAHATWGTAPFWLGCSGSFPLQPRSLPVWLSRVWVIEEDSEGQAVEFRWGGSWGSGTVVHPATRVLCGWYNEICAALGQVPKQRWSVPVACLVLPPVCCHWCSGCCQIHIVYVSGPLSMFHLNNPYRFPTDSKLMDQTRRYRLAPASGPWN